MQEREIHLKNEVVRAPRTPLDAYACRVALLHYFPTFVTLFTIKSANIQRYYLLFFFQATALTNYEDVLV